MWRRYRLAFFREGRLNKFSGNQKKCINGNCRLTPGYLSKRRVPSKRMSHPTTKKKTQIDDISNISS